MNYIEWNEQFSVRVAELDDQHKVLFRLINEMLDALHKRGGADVLAGVLKELKDYTRYHFGKEEQYMEKYDYPAIEEHKKEHRIFEDMVDDIGRQFYEGELDLTLQVLDITVNWLKNHILGVDKKYSDFFNERGLY